MAIYKERPGFQHKSYEVVLTSTSLRNGSGPRKFGKLIAEVPTIEDARFEATKHVLNEDYKREEVEIVCVNREVIETYDNNHAKLFFKKPEVAPLPVASPASPASPVPTEPEPFEVDLTPVAPAPKATFELDDEIPF
jgi:hypothetical protein